MTLAFSNGLGGVKTKIFLYVPNMMGPSRDSIKFRFFKYTSFHVKNTKKTKLRVINGLRAFQFKEILL